MFSKQIHRYLFLFGLITLPFGIMLGNFPGSLPIVILGANWLLEGQFGEKWFQLKNNKLFWALISLFLLYLFGLVHTQDFSSALDELRVGLPFISLPLILFSSAVPSKKEIDFSLYAFVTGCILNTVWCLLHGFVIHHELIGRNLSRFMSHIRLGLFIDMACACCIYFFYHSNKPMHKYLWLCLFIYFVSTLIFLGLVSGLVIFLVLFLLFLFYFFLKQNRTLKLLGLLLFFSTLILLINYVNNISKAQASISNSAYNMIKQSNQEGRSLIQMDSAGMVENGNYVFRNIQLEDLKSTWNARVPEDSFSYDRAYNLHRYAVLLRYLSSANLTKDKEGVKKLSEKDIQNIKSNIPNYKLAEWSFLRIRIYELINDYTDYKNGRDVNGHSFGMRLYFWHTALVVMQQNFWFGVGTGDIQLELNKVYKSKFKDLSSKYYLKPHNQFLSIAVSFGFFGLIIFLVMLLFPFYYLSPFLSPLYKVFFTILLLSFLTEDTLGTQAGAAFYVIFNTIFCAEAYFRKQQTLVD